MGSNSKFEGMGLGTLYKSWKAIKQGNWFWATVLMTVGINGPHARRALEKSESSMSMAAYFLIFALCALGLLLSCYVWGLSHDSAWPRESIFILLTFGVYIDLLSPSGRETILSWGYFIQDAIIILIVHYKLKELFPLSVFSSSVVLRGMLLLLGLTRCTADNLHPMILLVMAKCMHIFFATSSIQIGVRQAIASPLNSMMESAAWTMYGALIQMQPTIKPPVQDEVETRTPQTVVHRRATQEAAVPMASASTVAVPDTFNAVKTAYMMGAVTRRSTSTREEVSSPLDVVAIPMVMHHPTEGIKVVSMGPKCVRQTDFLPPISFSQCESSRASTDAPTPPNTPTLRGSKSQKGVRCFNRLTLLGRKSSPGLTIRDTSGEIVLQQSPRASRLSQARGLPQETGSCDSGAGQRWASQLQQCSSPFV